MQGADLMVPAQTGTGKTLAFGLPLAAPHHRPGTTRRGPRYVRALILVPTRELANQSANNCPLHPRNGAQSADRRGGASINKQSQGLARGWISWWPPPGRLIDLLERQMCH